MQNVRKHVLVTAALVAAVAGRAAAQGDSPGAIIPSAKEATTRQGTRGANFLENAIGARGSAMAGAIASTVTGPTAWYWNPAGAASTEDFEVAATRQNLYTGLDISQMYVGVSIPFLGGVVGASVNSLNSGDIQRTTEVNPYGDPVVGKTFNWNSSAIGLGYARRLVDRLDVGGQLKFISEGLSDASTSWAALDFGTQFRTGIYGLTLGAALQNVGPSARASGAATRQVVNTDQFSNQQTRVAYNTEDTEQASLYRFSVGADLFGRSSSVFGQTSKTSTFDAEVAFTDAIDAAPQMGIGAEYGFKNIAFLRAGKRFYNDQRATGTKGMYGLSGGAGLRLPLKGRALRFDYGFTSLGELSNVQVFSFELGH